MGTTVTTNAARRRSDPTVLVIGRLEDAIRIGGQQRPDIFALDIKLPEMLYARVIGAAERIGANGALLEPLDTDKLRADLAAVFDAGYRSVAIVLLHGYRFPQHEAAAAAIAREIGFAQVSVSHQVLPLPKLVTRGDTTLADAYLSPVLDRYVASVRRGLARDTGAPRLLFMQSHGGLAAAEHFRGKDSLLSGPAGGVIGMLHAARAVGCSEVIGFDMGGTSTDVALYAGELERTTDSVIASVRISAPMLRIHTVAAGGGSILTFGQGRLKVGPASAGAFPGPACYRHGGPLTVTDANVLLGRIQPQYFPRVFGPNGDEPLDREASNAAFVALAEKLLTAGQRLGPEQLAMGFLRIAVERMANAIREISVQRGHDVTRFTLCCFGGAGGQHAAQVAEALGIATVIIHPFAGLLSAYGIGVADVRVVRQQSVEAPLDSTLMGSLPQRFAQLANAAIVELREQASDTAAVRLEHRVRVKVSGSDTAIAVAWRSDTNLEALTAASRA
jgi:5-oxoprolinase (ATP-hydrolysing)